MSENALFLTNVLNTDRKSLLKNFLKHFIQILMQAYVNKKYYSRCVLGMNVRNKMALMTTYVTKYYLSTSRYVLSNNK